MVGAPSPQPIDVALFAGEALWGAWRVDRYLGTANSTSFYEVTGVGGQPAVLHVLDPAASRDEGRVARFVREARVARLVNHPRVVAALDERRTDGGAVCLVFERLVGFSCEQLAGARRPPLDPAGAGRLDAGEVAIVAEHALEALSAIHAKGLLHAGITPSTLVWTEERGLMLAGLGGARPFGRGRAEVGAGEEEDPSSLPFLAPEQVLGDHRRFDARTDLWSLGASLFFLLSGRTAREGAAGREQLLAALSRPAPNIADLVPDVPPDLEALIDVALAIRPDDRWRSAEETLTSLRAFRSPTTRTALFTVAFEPTGGSPQAAPGGPPHVAPANLPRATMMTVLPVTGHAQNTVPPGPDTPVAASPDPGQGLSPPPRSAARPQAVTNHATMKAVEWTAPPRFLDLLEKNGTDIVTFRRAELILFAELSRGTVAERVRAAEELHDSLRDALRSLPLSSETAASTSGPPAQET